jgi:hypothetical protein
MVAPMRDKFALTGVGGQEVRTLRGAIVRTRSTWPLVASLAAFVALSACGFVPESESASTAARVVVTGYGTVSPSGGRGQPVSVTATAAEAHRLRVAIDTVLGNRNSQTSCHAFYVLYAIAFYERGASSPSRDAFGEDCAGDNLWYQLSGGASRAGSPHYVVRFDAHCRLLQLVVSLLPPGTAGATRSALSGCLRYFVRG